MNSRERVIAAMNHREPDRVPIDFGATRSGGISAITYNALKKHLGVESGETKVYDIQQQLAWPDEWLLQKYNVDVIDVGQAFLKRKEDWIPFQLNDGSQGVIPAYHKTETDDDGNIYLYTAKGTQVGVKPPSSYYFNQNHWPWQDLEELPDPVCASDFDEQLWDVPSSPYHLDILNNVDDLQTFADGVRDLYENTSYALLLDFGIAGFFEAPGYMRGLENWFCDFMIDKAGTKRVLDAYTERCLERLDKILGAVGGYLQILRLFWDDMGNQNNTQMPPDLFKEMFAPHYRTLIDFIHSKSDCKVLVHSCGAVHDIIPHLIDAGVEMLNPIQISCDNMDPLTLKKEFGKDLVFWGGGCDTVNVLTSGTPEQVADHVKQNIEIFGPGGGFVFVHTHNVQPGVRPENVVAMLEAANQYGASLEPQNIE